MGVWKRLLSRHRGLPALWRRYYHTRDCFGHWGKPSPRQVEVNETWVRNRVAQANLWRLATAYRDHGHRRADLDPLGIWQCESPPELSLAGYGLEGREDKLFRTEGIVFAFPKPEAPLSEIVQHLEQAYCGTMALEVAHVESYAEREWLTQHFEEGKVFKLPAERRKKLAELLVCSQAFDRFLCKKFGLEGYDAEGAESMIAFFQEVFLRASEGGITDVVLGMPYRGRLNLLVGLLQCSPNAIFYKVVSGGLWDPNEFWLNLLLSSLCKTKGKFQGNSKLSEGIVDSPIHLGASVDLEMGEGGKLHVSILPNPSHLEAVNPVAMGKTRARQLSQRGGPYSSGPHSTHFHNSDNKMEFKNKVLNLLVHGDIAFTGQGIVTESLGLSSLPHFDVGGTVHLVVNNQVGVTTEWDHARSSRYCTDISKMILCPVIHVNGDHPEEVVRATRIAVDYWLEFEKDIVVDMMCFRRRGHDEHDPSLTQPVMYNVINNRSSVPDLYVKQLESAVDVQITAEEISNVTTSYVDELNQCLQKAGDYTPPASHLRAHWSGMHPAPNHITAWDTGCPVHLLQRVGAKSVTVPPDYNVNKRLNQSHIQERLRRLEEGRGIDWSTAEALAIGTLLHKGFSVRLSGQDVGRGTFNHRHVMVVCQDTDRVVIPLNHITEEQTAFLEVANSPLNEEAVLGFEYGFSIESPQHLVIWEAHYGDFFNTAQAIIDTFVSSGEEKWLLQSGLVMLLPHGFDGGGPEHSSCRVERFLQLCNSSEGGTDGDCINMHVTHPTTPAQYYHLLRRQMVCNFRKPLIIQSPKILLRLPAAVSTLEEMAPGTTFQPLLQDPHSDPQQVTRVVFCSGKHYYTLDEYRMKKGIQDTAIVRLELLCPFPSANIYQELSRYPTAKAFIWSQEEPQNMGPWSFVEPRFRKQLGCQLSFVGREPSSAPATGISSVHLTQAQKLLTETFPLVGDISF